MEFQSSDGTEKEKNLNYVTVMELSWMSYLREPTARDKNTEQKEVQDFGS
jgi:hypothetical protein